MKRNSQVNDLFFFSHYIKNRYYREENNGILNRKNTKINKTGNCKYKVKIYSNFVGLYFICKFLKKGTRIAQNNNL